MIHKTDNFEHFLNQYYYSMEDKENIPSDKNKSYQDKLLSYKEYLSNFEKKVQCIYEKQLYRNYLKGKKYDRIHEKTLRRKQQLAKELEDKKKSSLKDSEKLVHEIGELEKLNTSFQQILKKYEGILEDQKDDLRIENDEKQDLEDQIKKKWSQLKNQELFFTEIQETTKRDGSLYNNTSFTQTILDSTFQKSIFSKHRKKQKKRSEMKESKMKKLEERIDEEDKKLMMLKLFVAFLKKIDLMNDSMALSLHLIKYFEEIALQKQKVLDKVKQIKKTL